MISANGAHVDARSPGSPRASVLATLARGANRAETPLLLAPMASLTHAGLRSLVDEFGGCDLFFTEMISAEALLRSTPYETFYLSNAPDSGRLIYQLLGYSDDAILRAAQRLVTEECAGIDVNMGCSAPHITRKGGGIAWMREVDRAARLIAALRPVVSNRTLSAKLRLGREDDPDALLQLASALVDAGVDFLTLHPKRQKEGSARRARWSYVRLLRGELQVPVVGNGGVTDFATFTTRLDEAGPGPVMIGRGAARAPWIFAYLRMRLRGEAVEYRVGLDQVAKRFFELLEEHQPPDFWPTRARRFLPYFTSNLRFGHSLGARLEQMRSYEQGQAELSEYFAAHPETAHHVERG